MRAALLALVFAVLADRASADPPRPPKTNHPILGTWIFAVPETDCEETYYMRQDGTTLVTSGQEVAESVYEIDDEPSAKGFYKSTDRIVKDNGKPDCAGDITKVGSQGVHDAKTAAAAIAKHEKQGVRLYVTNPEGAHFVFVEPHNK